MPRVSLINKNKLYFDDSGIFQGSQVITLIFNALDFAFKSAFYGPPQEKRIKAGIEAGQK